MKNDEMGERRKGRKGRKAASSKSQSHERETIPFLSFSSKPSQSHFLRFDAPSQALLLPSSREETHLDLGQRQAGSSRCHPRSALSSARGLSSSDDPQLTISALPLFVASSTGVTEAFKRDKDPRKINLGVGEFSTAFLRVFFSCFSSSS